MSRRLLLGVGLIVGVFALSRCAGWYVLRAKHVEAQRTLVSVVRELEGNLYYDHELQSDGSLLSLEGNEGTNLIGKSLGRDWGHDVFYVSFAEFRSDEEYGLIATTKAEINDTMVDLIANVPSIRWVALNGSAISDAGVQKLCDQLDLERVWIGRTSITDASLKALAQCQSLEYLAIEATQTSDDGVRAVAALPKLKFLSLGSAQITPSGLASLSGAKELQHLQVDFLRVDQRAVKAFEALPSLEALYARQCYVNDAAFNGFSHQTLETLHLDANPITDNGLIGLDLPNLKTLSIRQTQISDEGLRHLANCEKLETLGADRSQCTFTGLVNFFRDELGRSENEALSSFAQVKQDDEGNVTSLQSLGVRFSDADLPIVSRLSELQWLDLSSSQITDDGAKELSQFTLPKLNMVKVSYTGLTATGVDHLCKIPTLRDLHVVGIDVSEDKLKEITANYPSLTVYTTDFNRP